MRNLTVLLLLFSNIILAQSLEGPKVYLDYMFKKTENPDAPYYSVIEGINYEKEEYPFKIFYASGSVLKEGNTRSKTSLIENGLITTYYENGNKKEEYTIEKGFYIGNKATWYENGDKRNIKECYKGTNELMPTTKILQFWDEDNIQKVIDGNGLFEDEENGCHEKGMVQDGLKTGKWEGTDKLFKITFKEDYENGKLINGVSIDSASVEHFYTAVRENAKPRKGYDHFYKYIGKKFRFTKKTEGQSGKIVLTFIVEKDGSISEITVVRSAGEDFDNEGIRLISNYPDWEPGKYRGRIVRVLFSIPITIKAPI